MTNVRVTLNQVVDSSTVIGDVGRTGATNEHLHFTVYSGTNTRGNLQSFNTTITERGTGTPPTIASITPNTVNASDTPQLVTINGSGFAANAKVEVQKPSGSSFPKTPETVSANSITVLVPLVFSGSYKFTVINPTSGASSTGTCPQICVTVTAISQKTPVIIIPGILGSRISKWNPTTLTLGEELWPASFRSDRHREIANTDNVENPDGPYREIRDRPVVATEIVRSLVFDRYGNLIDWLVNNGGYTLYDKRRPTLETCDLNQVGADLFVFPYDWRNSNWTSARDLDRFVQCIRAIRQNPAGFKVRIVAHSMGGLVARRYILDHPGTNYVDRMVSLGTPWLGSPEIIQALEDGTIDIWTNTFWITKASVHEIAPFLKGAHELIPGYAYTDVMTGPGYGPFGERGWDFNNNGRSESDYDFATFKAAMNQYGHSPGTHTDGFHNSTLMIGGALIRTWITIISMEEHHGALQ